MCLVLLTMTSPQHRQSNSGPTMRECLLADSSPVPYPLPRAPMAPLCVCAAPMRPCMSPWPLAIPVDGPTAWLRSTWMASSKRSRRSSMRLCCRVKGQKEIRNLPKCSFKLVFFCAGHLKTLRNKTAFYHLWWVIRESGKIRFGVNLTDDHRCFSVCMCSPESAVEPRSLAMMLPARHSSTRRLNWQLGERRQGHIMLRWRGLRQIKSKGNLREFRPEADMSRWSGWEFNFFSAFLQCKLTCLHLYVFFDRPSAHWIHTDPPWPCRKWLDVRVE